MPDAGWWCSCRRPRTWPNSCRTAGVPCRRDGMVGWFFGTPRLSRPTFEDDADLRCGAGAPEAEVNALPQGLVGPFGGDALDLSLVRFRPVHEVDVEGDHVALRGGAVLDPPCLHVVEARTGKRDAARTDPAERRRMGRPADEAAPLAPRRRGRPGLQEAAGAGNEIATSQHGNSPDTDAGPQVAGKYRRRQIFRKRTRRLERNSGGV